MRPIIPDALRVSRKAHAYCIECEFSLTREGAQGADEAHNLAAEHIAAEGHEVHIDSYVITRERFGTETRA